MCTRTYNTGQRRRSAPAARSRTRARDALNHDLLYGHPTGMHGVTNQTSSVSHFHRVEQRVLVEIDGLQGNAQLGCDLLSSIAAEDETDRKSTRLNSSH